MRESDKAAPRQLRHIGIVDVGSNSVRFMLAEVHRDLSFQVVDQWKEVLRLGDEYEEDGSIPSHKVDKLIATVMLFKRLGDSYEGCEIVAVATAAMRKATNGQAIVQQIEQVTGIQMRIINGEAEAYLDYLAVVSTMNVKDALMLDIGGGSLELVLIRDREQVHSVSLPVGALTLAGDFHVKEALDPEEERRIIEAADRMMQEVPWLQEAAGLPLIGVGGTMRTLAKIDKHERKYPIDSLHHYEMSRDSVEKWHSRLKPMTLQQREAVQGLSKDRADIIMGSFTWIMHWMNKLELSKLIVSAKGVREGVLFDVLRGEGLVIEEPLKFSIHNLINRLHLNRGHANQVYRLMQWLYTGLERLHGLGPDWQPVVQTSALLHECGVAIHHLERERHAFYMMMNADLYGLTPRELILSAFAASMDRKQKVNDAWKAYDSLLLPEDKQAARTLSLLLRLAIALDRTKTASVRSVRCDIGSHDVTIYVQADTSLVLEVSEAYALRASFRKLLKRELVIVTEVIPPSVAK
ncbi:Ppx/GppA phosphatase family protein [Paenibacillus marinisediminis]